MALSVMKKQNDDGLLKGGRSILDFKKNRIGTEYSLYSGPLNTKVKVYDESPEEHHVMVPNKPTKVMSRKGVEDYISTGAWAEDAPLKEMLLKEKISKAQDKDLEKLKK